jgi:hypothetical protein
VRAKVAVSAEGSYTWPCPKYGVELTASREPGLDFLEVSRKVDRDLGTGEWDVSVTKLGAALGGAVKIGKIQ